MIKYISRRQSVKMYSISDSDANHEEEINIERRHKMSQESIENGIYYGQSGEDIEKIHEIGSKKRLVPQLCQNGIPIVKLERSQKINHKDIDIEKAYKASQKEIDSEVSYKNSQTAKNFERSYKNYKKEDINERSIKGSQKYLDVERGNKSKQSKVDTKRVSRNYRRFHWPRRKFFFEIGFYGMTLMTILLLLILVYLIVQKSIYNDAKSRQTVTVIKTRKKERGDKNSRPFIQKAYPDPSDPTYALCGPCPAPECPPHSTLECSCGDEDYQSMITVSNGPCIQQSTSNQSSQSQTPVDSATFTPKPVAKSKCLSRDCIIEASELLTSIDEKSDPCKCLHEYTCGRMLSKKKQCLELTSENEFKQSKLHGIFNQLVKEEMRNPLSSEIHRFYKSCIAQDEIERRGNRPLMRLIELLGGWPLLESDYLVRDFDVTGLIIKAYSIGAFYSALFKVEFGADSNHEIMINFPSLGLNDTGQYMNKHWRGYFELMIDTAVKLGSGKENAIKSMNSVLEFEAKLAELKYYEEFQSSKELGERINLRKLSSVSSKIDWIKIIKQMIKIPVNENQMVKVQSINFLKQVDLLLMNTNNRITWNYFIWRVILDAMQHLSNSWRNMYCSSLKISNYRSHAERCKQLSFDYFHRLMPLIYYKENKQRLNEINIRSIIHVITESCLKYIQMLTFFDYQTQREATSKVKMYRDFLLDIDDITETDIIDQIVDKLRMDQDKYFENVLNIKKLYREMVVYSFQINRPQLIKFINFKDGLINDHKKLSIYLYNILDEISETKESTIELINFVNIGIKILRQLKAMLFGAKSFPHEKDSSINWWTDNSLALFSEKITCYEAIFNQQIRRPNLRRYLTRINYISEHLALIIIEDAFNKSYRLQEVDLPGLTFTKNQLFYLKLAKLWCLSLENVIRQPNEENLLQIIDILFRNLNGYNGAFSCSPTSVILNEINQCAILKNQ